MTTIVMEERNLKEKSISVWFLAAKWIRSIVK
jgi:hypothetical protein